MEKLLIDVSEHNGKIDWETVKNYIDGAIIRCGYGMDETNQDDKQWKRNVAECERLGIPFGVYLYSYATSKEKAKSEAQHVLRLINGHTLSYPVYFDMEEPGTENVSVENAKIFGDIIEKAGYWCGIYCGKDWYKTVVKGQLKRFTLWIAEYGSNNGQMQDNYKPNLGEDIWQYSSVGKMQGISETVDLNVCYRNFPLEINRMKEQWIKDEKGWWYRHGDGTYTKNNWEYINKKWYYFDKNGYMVTGWKKVEEYWYYMDISGAMQTGWIYVGENWFYLNGSGQMYENTWYKEEEQWYYLKAGGYMARNELLKIGNEKFAFLDSGRMVRTNARGALV